jgi:serine/threonine protein kinase
MVEYFGEYVHEEEETEEAEGNHSVGTQRVKTFNILLEWGERDLEEYFFDKSSYPPVRTQEITKFYQNIFEIAEAIQHIHKLEKVENGETRVYCGWHCDIKPDNILRMKNGKFKLTDFGFAKFRLRNDKDGERAQEKIDPATLAYSERTDYECTR